jgi:hypothetical protein
MLSLQTTLKELVVTAFKDTGINGCTGCMLTGVLPLAGNPPIEVTVFVGLNEGGASLREHLAPLFNEEPAEVSRIVVPNLITPPNP